MKKMQKRFYFSELVAVLLAMAMAMVMTACPEPDNSGGIDTASLTAVIDEAEGLLEGIIVATNANEVAKNVQFVPTTAKNTFVAAIDTAKAVRNNPASDSAVTAAKETLKTAITAFKGAWDKGSKESGWTLDELETLFEEATASKTGVTGSSDGTDVSKTEHWVPTDVFAALNTAITAAGSLVETKSTVTNDIDEAYNALAQALQAFDFAKKLGTGNATAARVDYSTTLSWGNAITPTTLGLTPGATTTELRLNWLGTGNNNTPKVRFIEGTLTEGTDLIVVDGTLSGSVYQVKATVPGLKPGASYQYSVSNDGNNWSPMYDVKIPAATGTFKFAVIADPQLTTGNVDADSRYPATGTTTAAGWVETMGIIMTKGVSFIAGLGDQVDTANNTTQYANFFAPAGMRTLPFSPAVGNHDTNVMFRQRFNTPNEQIDSDNVSEFGNYYYLYNNILFVVLNTSQSVTASNAGAGITRFDNTLKAAKNAHPQYDWLIVQHHKSTASVGDHAADADIEQNVRAGFETLMSTHKVDFVLAGHDHVYARSYPLKGMADGKVSIPDTTFVKGGDETTGANPNGDTWNSPQDPIYLTFTTGSGLKYYAVSADPYFKYNNTLYVKNSATYPYLKSAAGDGVVTMAGSTNYMEGNLPWSNAAYVQPYIPSYCVVEVSNGGGGTRSITFSTYPIHTASGTDTGATKAYDFDADIPYDKITVTK